MGLIFSGWGIAMVAGELFWGQVHDRVDRVAPLILRAGSAGSAFLLMAMVSVAWPLFLLNIWRGFSDAASWPATRSMVSQAAPLTRTAQAMAVLGTGATLGFALGAFAGGQIAGAFGYRGAQVFLAMVSLSALVIH